MLEKAKDRFRALMAAEVARSGRDDDASREAAADKMKAAVEALIQRNPMPPEQAADLREALAQVLAEHATSRARLRPAFPPLDLDALPRAAVRAAPQRMGIAVRAAIGALALAAAAGVVIVLQPGIASALQAPSEEPAVAGPEIAKFQARLEASAKAVDDATRYLKRVQKAVEKRLKDDPVALTALAGDKFTSLRSIDRKLFRAMPKTVGEGGDVIVRASPAGYKILLKTALCTDIKYTKPKFVDPKRDPKTAGCQFAGVWNKAGRNF